MPGRPSFSIRWRAVHVPKQGHSADEYEDAHAAAPRAGRFAVADGASESSFAALWARLLVEGFTQPGRLRDRGADWLAPLCTRWASEVDGRPLPWYAEAKREEGAFATFLGLTLRRPSVGERGGRWRAWAVGDSCLFQVRSDTLVRAFPVARSEDFGNRPDLLGSRAFSGGEKARPQVTRGRWQAGDRFFLATDALAEWCLRQHEAGLKPWRSLEAILVQAEPQPAFTPWVAARHADDTLRNDDVTLLWVALGELAPAPGPSMDPSDRTPPEGPPATG